MRIDRTAAIALMFFSAPGLAASPQESDQYQTETLHATAPMVSWGGMGGLVMDTEGYLWHSNFGEYLWRIHAQSGEVTLIADGFLSSSGIDVLPGGDILQAEFGADRIMRVSRFSPHRMEVFADAGLGGPVGLEVVAGRRVYVANCIAGNISVVNGDGGVAEKFATHELFNCPNGITSTPDGSLFVVNNSDTYVFRVSPDGETSVFAHLPGIGHGHIEFARGALFVTQLWTHKVVRLDMDGNITTIAGNGRPGLDDGMNSSARVSHPNGIAANPGGSVLYHNSIDGPMLINDGANLVIRRTYLPTPSRVIREAFYAEGIDAMLGTYERLVSNPGTEAGEFGSQVRGIATIMLQQGHFEAAVSLLQHHLTRTGADVSTLQSLGDAHAAHGDRRLARSFYEDALDLAPGNQGLSRRLADLHQGETHARSFP